VRRVGKTAGDCSIVGISVGRDDVGRADGANEGERLGGNVAGVGCGVGVGVPVEFSLLNRTRPPYPIG